VRQSKLAGMNKLNASVLPLVGLSVVLSFSALIAVCARWQNPSTTVVRQAAVVHRATPAQTVKVVMHDPGCHSFQTSGGFARTMHVSGAANLVNMDEATLKIAGASGTKLDKVGARVRLARGTYTITMVGQASDDNHLKLVVT
jgi:hypothetical protein